MFISCCLVCGPLICQRVARNPRNDSRKAPKPCLSEKGLMPTKRGPPYHRRIDACRPVHLATACFVWFSQMSLLHVYSPGTPNQPPNPSPTRLLLGNSLHFAYCGLVVEIPLNCLTLVSLLPFQCQPSNLSTQNPTPPPPKPLHIQVPAPKPARRLRAPEAQFREADGS